MRPLPAESMQPLLCGYYITCKIHLQAFVFLRQLQTHQSQGTVKRDAGPHGTEMISGSCSVSKT